MRPEYVGPTIRDQYKHLSTSVLDAGILALALKRGYHALTNGSGQLAADPILSAFGGRLVAHSNWGTLDYVHPGLSGLSLSFAPNQAPIIASVLRRLAGSQQIGHDAKMVLIQDDVISMIFKSSPVRELRVDEAIAAKQAACTSMVATVHTLFEKLRFATVVSATHYHPSKPDWIDGTIINEDGHQLKLECRHLKDFLSTRLPVHGVIEHPDHLAFTIDKLTFARALQLVKAGNVELVVAKSVLLIIEEDVDCTITHGLTLCK